MKFFISAICLLFLSTSCKKDPSENFYKSSDSRSFEDIWEAYKVQVMLKREGANFKFNPPANLKEVSQWEQVLKQTLPEELLELYKIGNGQAEDGQSIIKGFSLMPIVNAARQWQLVDNKIAKITIPNSVKGPVKQEIWNTKWIPFASDPGGNFLCIDLDPEKGGHAGQIVAIYFQAGIREVIAPSVKEYFSQSESGLKAGKLGFDAFGVGPTPIEN